MKKALSVLMAVIVMLVPFAFCETASPAEPLKEGEMYFHGYKNTATGYYVGVPAEWALVGINAAQENLQQAYDIIGYDKVKAVLDQLNAENDILFAASGEGQQLVITYGASDGIPADRLADELDAFKSILSAEYKGIVFADDCGEITVNELNTVLYIGATYKSHAISQYIYPMGQNMYVFTFTDVDSDIATAVLSTFSIQK